MKSLSFFTIFSFSFALGILLVGYAVFVFVDKEGSVDIAQAGTSDNISGWAWSENIGWISFNCTNDHDENTAGVQTCIDVNPISPDYGVNVNLTGAFSGFAWSENIGWIQFDPTPDFDTGIFPSNPQSPAQLNLATDDVTGWARACAGTVNGDCVSSTRTDGWDGWIKMAKHPLDLGAAYGVSVNKATLEFHGHAWGSDVVGWISFNCEEGGAFGEDICATVSFKVTPGPIVFNGPPTAAFSCNPADCIGYTGGGLQLLNDSIDPENDILESKWTGIPPAVTCPPDSVDPLCDYTTQPVGVGTYTVQLRVEDSIGSFDTHVENIDIRQDIIANFDCSLSSSGPWESCASISVLKGETVHFRGDISTPSVGAFITSYSWTFENGNPASSSATNTLTAFQTSGGNTVSLQVQDDAGRIDTMNVSIGIGLPFPQWQEISPF